MGHSINKHNLTFQYYSGKLQGKWQYKGRRQIFSFSHNYQYDSNCWIFINKTCQFEEIFFNHQFAQSSSQK